MFTAKFYKFSKRVNSTKQPSGGTDYNIIIKTGSSAINPTISLDVGQSGNPTEYNYCYIPEFKRYYWINDWYYENALWTCSLNSDPLASFKSYIGAYHGYVTRAASRYNLDVVDGYYPAIAKNTHAASTATQGSPFQDEVDDGCFILGIQGKGSGGNGGAVTYYVATAAAVKTLVNYLLGDPTFYNVTEIEEQLLQCVFNPLQYIVSCMWFPFTVAGVSGDVDVGWWDLSVTGMNPLGNTLDWGINLTFDIPKHPKAESRGKYLNLQPFSRYMLEAGPWGMIQLDPFNLLDDDTLTAFIRVDLMTGTGMLNIKFRDELVYESVHTAQIGVPIQLGQNMFNQGALHGVINHTIDTVRGMASGKPWRQGLNSGLATIHDAAALTVPIPSSIGSNGTLAFNNIFALLADFLDIADEDLASRGRPLCERAILSSFQGFVMCEDADPEIPCTAQELSKIVSELNGGFYYE